MAKAIGSRFVDESKHLQARDLARVLCGLSLAVVKVSRNSNHGLRHGSAKIAFGRLLHLLPYDGAYLAWAVLLSHGLNPGVAIWARNDLVGGKLLFFLDDRIVITTSNQALDGENRVFGVCHGLP